MYVLAALALVVVVLTRMRLKPGLNAAGRTKAIPAVVNVHTVAGLLGVVAWTLFLAFGNDTFLGGPGFGIVALGLLWITVVAGLLILVRWLPTRGRHAGQGGEDNWSQGPGLSLLAHLGMFAGVLFDTVAYLLEWV